MSALAASACPDEAARDELLARDVVDDREAAGTQKNPAEPARDDDAYVGRPRHLRSVAL